MALKEDDPNRPVLVWIGGLSMTLDAIEETVNSAPPGPYKVLVRDYLDEEMRAEMKEPVQRLLNVLEKL